MLLHKSVQPMYPNSHAGPKHPYHVPAYPLYKNIKICISNCIVMEKGNSLTFTRRTFKFGNSQAITIPAALSVPVKSMLKVTVEMVDQGPEDQSN